MENKNKKEVIGSRKIIFNKKKLFDDTENSSIGDIKITKEPIEKKVEVVQEKKVEQVIKKTVEPETELLNHKSVIQSELFKAREMTVEKEKKTLNEIINIILDSKIFKNIIFVISLTYIIFNLLIMSGNILHYIINHDTVSITISMWQFMLYIVFYIITLALSILSIIKIKNPYLIILIIILINIII